MRRNPSEKQKIASRKNLAGKEGPKTKAGKARSARNGKLNKGPGTAKAKARILDKRHGLKESYYALSGCLHCGKVCPGKSFSIDAPLDDYSFVCLGEVIIKHPSACFYYFHGLCGIRYDNKELSLVYCILDDQELQSFSPDADKDNRVSQELEYRKRFMKLKKTLDEYLAAGKETKELTPKIQSAFLQLKNMFSSYKLCKHSEVGLLQLEDRIQELVMDPDSF